jgi:hypothetical protein
MNTSVGNRLSLVLFYGIRRSRLSTHGSDGDVEESDDGKMGGTGGEHFALDHQGMHSAAGHWDIDVGDQDYGDGKNEK